MKLTATRQTYRFEDESGYSFDVVAEHDPERGWGATVTMKTRGYITAGDAIRHLTLSAEAFVEQVKAGVE